MVKQILISENDRIIQSRRLVGLGKPNEALKLLLSDDINKTSLLLSEGALIEFFEFNNLENAVELIDNAFLLTSQDFPDVYINCLIKRSEIRLNANMLNLGLDDANKIFEISNKHDFKIEEAIGEYLIAQGSYFKGNIHIALEFAKSAVDKLQELKQSFSYYFLKSQILYGLCQKSFGKINLSIEIFSNAEYLAKTQYFNLNLLASVLNILGELKLSIGEYKDAERYLKSTESLSLYNEKLQETYNKSIADIGELYYLQGDIDKSIKFINTAVDKNKSRESNIYSINTLGQIYRRIGELDIAKTYFEDAYKLILTHQKFHPLHTTILINYARTIILINKTDSLDQAFEIILKVKSLTAVQGLISPPKLLNTEGMYYSTKKEFGLAKQIFNSALQNAKAQNSYFDMIECYLFLAEINLELYRNDSTKNTYFNEAKDNIQQALDLSLNENIIPTIIKIRILSAVINASELNFGIAFQELNQAKIEAENKNLEQDLQEITQITHRLQSQLPKLSQNETINSIISLISRFTDSSSTPLIYKKDISLITYKFTERGPTPFYYSHDNTNDLINLSSIGVVLMSLLGQGHSYFTGLFGPIPIKELPDHLVLCYTANIYDDALEDTRLAKTNYLLIATLFPKIADDYILFNRKAIQGLLEEFTLTNVNLSHWTENNLNDLYSQIVGCFTIKSSK